MKILLINPSRRHLKERDFWDGNYTMRVFGVTCAMPLWAPTLAALTPGDVEVKIVDENVEDIDFEEEADLVGIGAFSITIQRGYEIANEFKKRKIKVVMGGIHVSTLPDEAMRHADSIVIGEAEKVWAKLIEDFKNNNLKQVYKGDGYPCLDDTPVPRYDLLKNDRYSANLIQTTRGCPFDCEFCSVKAFQGPEFRLKRVEQVIKEIEACPRSFQIKIMGRKLEMEKGFFFVDDNIIGNKVYAGKLFEAIKPLKLPGWWCQCSINVGKDPELLRMMKDAGCARMFVGIESVERKSLEEMGKKINKIDEYERCIENIHSAGIAIMASIIVGSDNDDETVFEKVVNFIRRNNIALSMINILVPIPGTRLFERLNREGRILHNDWKKFDSANVCFRPKKMSPETLAEGFRWIYRELYSIDRLSERIKGFWKKGNVQSGDYERELKGMSQVDKLFFAFLLMKYFVWYGKWSGIKLNLNLLPDVLKGRGEFGILLHAMFFRDFAFSLTP